MRAVLCTAFEGIKSLSVGETAAPEPKPDEVLIDVHAASVSYMDYLMVSGGYQMRPPLPYVPGTDAAGVVVAVGSQVDRFRPGDRVTCEGWHGGYAEQMTAKASRTSRLPDNVDFSAGSTVLQAYLTAYYTLVDRVRVVAGETVLVTGAAGGVGLACVELARLLGGRVIGAVGSAAKAAIVRDYGAEAIINYSSEDVRERVKALTAGEGIDVGIDNVGGALFGTLARLMRWNGRLAPIGFVCGEIPSLPMNLPLLKNFSIIGVYAGAWVERYPNESARAADEVLQWVSEGALRPRIDRVLRLDQAPEAMTAIQNRSVSGRIVLQVR
jgi:NADPH:quinone reductase